ncbi:MAG: transcriptional regulator [Bacteroidota bacterium]
MKDALEHFDKAFESKIRLQIMSVLLANDTYDFNALKELLNITDGNLASHAKVLEKEQYINVIKSYNGRKPNTKYQATASGKKAFRKHLETLEQLIRKQQP